MNSPRRDQVAAAVRVELARQRRTTAELADGIDMNRITLGRRLSGEYPFTLDEFAAVATWLGLTPEQLYERAKTEEIAS